MTYNPSEKKFTKVVFGDVPPELAGIFLHAGSGDREEDQPRSVAEIETKSAYLALLEPDEDKHFLCYELPGAYKQSHYLILEHELGNLCKLYQLKPNYQI